MTTYEMLRKTIGAKKQRGTLDSRYAESLKVKMDVFLMNDRITKEEYSVLITELG